MNKLRYKFLRTGMKSENGNHVWRLNKWYKVDGELDMCNVGFHCSIEPYDAFSYVQGEILALVECRGKHLSDDNKECWEEQRVTKTAKWVKKDSVALAIFSAELVIKNYEKEYPNDLRPREAIEAAKKVLFHDTKTNRDAAWSAASSAASSAAWSASSAASSAAWSARSAASSAAWSAAWSAWSAASSAASSAARSAAWSAARSAARSAVWSAASSATTKKIQVYFKKVAKEKLI